MTNTAQKRSLLWHLKWLFACFAAAFALFLATLVVSLAFSGPAFGEWWSSPIGHIAMFAVAVALSPLIYRRLR